MSICGDNLVYHCDLFDGIEAGLLAPFRYLGMPDEVDYAQIPWRSTQFDPTALEAALATKARARNALDHFRQHGNGPAFADLLRQLERDRSLTEPALAALDTIRSGRPAPEEGLAFWALNSLLSREGRPHSSLGYKSPAPEAIMWPAAQPGPASPATPAVAPRPVMH